MRVLVANTPRMYRESLALSIRRQYPNFEVLIADLNKIGVVCWVGIIIDNHLHARISVSGRISEIHDVSLDEFIAALCEAEKLISANDGQETPTTKKLDRSS